MTKWKNCWSNLENLRLIQKRNFKKFVSHNFSVDIFVENSFFVQMGSRNEVCG